MAEQINIPDLINTVAAQTRKELMLIVTDSLPEAVNAVNLYVNNLKERAAALLENVQDTGSSKTYQERLSFLFKRLKEETEILKTQVLSLLIIGEGIAQNIINSIQNILLAAIQKILPAANV